MLLRKCSNVIKQGKCPIGSEGNTDRSVQQRQQAETLLCLYRQVNNGKVFKFICFKKNGEQVHHEFMRNDRIINLKPDTYDIVYSIDLELQYLVHLVMKLILHFTCSDSDSWKKGIERLPKNTVYWALDHSQCLRLSSTVNGSSM